MRETSGEAFGFDGQKYMISNVARNQTRVYATRLLSYVTFAFLQVSSQQKEDTQKRSYDPHTPRMHTTTNHSARF
jgi:hypothetical protein